MMSKKHYVAIAEVIRQDIADHRNRPDTGNSCAEAYALKVLEYTAGGLADVFASENPNFNRARFLKACGLEG